MEKQSVLLFTFIVEIHVSCMVMYAMEKQPISVYLCTILFVCNLNENRIAYTKSLDSAVLYLPTTIEEKS